jgi:hypothetical protein
MGFVKDISRPKSHKTKFGILTPTGLSQTMEFDVARLKSPDPLAYAYGLFQGKSGQPMQKGKGLAPEYIRGYKEGKKQR